MNDVSLGQLPGQHPVPVRRRWLPAASAGAVLLAGLIALTMQTLQFLESRRENTRLRTATARLDQLRQDHAEMQRLRAAAQSAGRRGREQEELAKLQAEAAQLRAAAQELPALRAESQRLQAERTAAADRAGVATEEDPFAKAKGRAQRINCISNIKQICLAARIWANDNKEVLPADFLTISNELSTPKILTCPGDTTRRQQSDWRSFDGNSVSYELLSPGVPETDPQVVFVRCPIHHNVGLVDGSAHQLSPTAQRVEQVEGKFRIVPIPQASQP